MRTTWGLTATALALALLASAAARAQTRYVPDGPIRFDCTIVSRVVVEEKSTSHRVRKSFSNEDFREGAGAYFALPKQADPWHDGHSMQIAYYSTKLRNGGERRQLSLSLSVENEVMHSSSMGISKVDAADRRIDANVSLFQWTRKDRDKSKAGLDPKFKMAKSYPPEPGLIEIDATCVLADAAMTDTPATTTP